MVSLLAWPRLTEEFRRLAPSSQARLFAAFLLLLALAIVLLLAAWVGIRLTRRYLQARDHLHDQLAAARRGQPGRRPDDWADKPLYDEPDDDPR